MNHPTISALALLVVTQVGCAAEKVSLIPEHRAGPAFNAKPKRVLVAPPTCGSIEFPCSDEYVSLVDGIVRSGLEFQGYSAIASDELLLTARQRTETRDDDSKETKTKTTTARWAVLPSGERTEHVANERTTRKHIELVGSTFEDLPHPERKALLQEAQAEGVVTTRLIVGATNGVWSPSQDVEVVVKLGVGSGDEMVWATRCVAPSSKFASARAAVEHAARCAMSPTERTQK